METRIKPEFFFRKMLVVRFLDNHLLTYQFTVKLRSVVVCSKKSSSNDSMIPIVGSSAPTPGSYTIFNDLNRNMVPKHKVYVQCVFSRKQPDIPTPLPTIPRFNEENSESRRNSSFSKARKDKGPKTSVFKSLER